MGITGVSRQSKGLNGGGALRVKEAMTTVTAMESGETRRGKIPGKGQGGNKKGTAEMTVLLTRTGELALNRGAQLGDMTGMTVQLGGNL